jgi:hypothetical protein
MRGWGMSRPGHVGAKLRVFVKVGNVRSGD